MSSFAGKIAKLFPNGKLSTSFEGGHSLFDLNNVYTAPCLITDNTLLIYNNLVKSWVAVPDFSSNLLTSIPQPTQWISLLQFAPGHYVVLIEADKKVYVWVEEEDILTGPIFLIKGMRPSISYTEPDFHIDFTWDGKIQRLDLTLSELKNGINPVDPLSIWDGLTPQFGSSNKQSLRNSSNIHNLRTSGIKSFPHYIKEVLRPKNLSTQGIITWTIDSYDGTLWGTPTYYIEFNGALVWQLTTSLSSIASDVPINSGTYRIYSEIEWLPRGQIFQGGEEIIISVVDTGSVSKDYVSSRFGSSNKVGKPKFTSFVVGEYKTYDNLNNVGNFGSVNKLSISSVAKIKQQTNNFVIIQYTAPYESVTSVGRFGSTNKLSDSYVLKIKQKTTNYLPDIFT